MRGRRVPSYELSFANRKVVVGVLEDVAERFTADDFIDSLRRKVNESQDGEWRRYVAFGKILLSEAAETIARGRSLYGDFLPKDVERGIARSLDLIHGLENQIRREEVSALLARIKPVLLKPSVS